MTRRIQQILRIVLFGLPATGCVLLLSGCGNQAPQEPAPRPEWKPIISRALEHAVADSSMLVDRPFAARGVMKMQVKDGSATAAVVDSFTILRRRGEPFRVLQRSHAQSGDSTMLEDTYTDREEKSVKSRDATQLAGLSFALALPDLYRILLNDSYPGGWTVRDSSAMQSGRRCWMISFSRAERFGRVWIDRETGRTIRLDVDQHSTIMGEYRNTLAIAFASRSGFWFPVAAASRFDYNSMTGNGEGGMSVTVERVAPM